MGNIGKAGECVSKRIVVLSEEVANQIAAGEVVERPASIVKELVENSLDAGATDIRVELEEGGCKSIRIADNGSGIDREDAALVFERHATSKIARLDDIYTAGSFGFRGEAMASIASIAEVELLTRRPEDLAGTRALARSGAIVDIAPAGCPAGTQITVTQLFANVPARRKFLKTQATELAACLDAVNRLALAHPEVRFGVKADGRDVFFAPAANGISERIAMILGADFTGESLEISQERSSVRLSGWISTPRFTRSNSKSIYLFVNSRFIRDTSLTHALLAAYRQVIEPRRYPAAVLFLELPGDEVDVNVHPAKLEVRFKNARDIYELVSQSVSQRLAGLHSASASVGYRLEGRETSSAASGFWRAKAPPAPSGFSPRLPDIFSLQNMKQAIERDLSSREETVCDPPAIYQTDAREAGIHFSGQTYLGQVDGTYLVFAGPEGLTLVDQHAAHERILLERLKAKSGGKALGQPLLMPEVVSLTAATVSLFEEARALLEELGIEVEIFGRDALVVKSLPASLPQASPREIITDLADQLADSHTGPGLDARKEKILASMACRAAVKAHAPLSCEDVASLCRDLEATPFNATCPHGRPTSIKFSLNEIERLFKRK